MLTFPAASVYALSANWLGFISDNRVRFWSSQVNMIRTEMHPDNQDRKRDQNYSNPGSDMQVFTSFPSFIFSFFAALVAGGDHGQLRDTGKNTGV